MPLTKKGKTIMESMMKEYKKPEKAKHVFYGMVNKGKLKGVEKGR